MRAFRAATAILAGLLVAAPAARGGEPATIDLQAMKRAASPAVGLVTVQNSMGLPVAYATGFLLGEGRFLITDLAALVRPDAVQATIQFEDGTTAVSKQFGLANPAIGLAVIQVGDAAPRPGLPLSSAAPGASPLPVALLGWQWGQAVTGVGGRLGTGPATADLASRLGVEAPVDKWDFLILNGGRLEGASGAPIIERSGAVIGISLALAGKTGTVYTVIPASVVRQALLSAKPELKPFSKLPKPLWPGQILRAPGEAPEPVEFAKLVAETKSTLQCKNCLGRGWVVVAGTGSVHRTCTICGGEKITCGDTPQEALFQMAAQGARMLLTPDTDPKTRKAAIGAAAEVLQSVVKADRVFRPMQLRLTGQALAKPALPRGLVAYAQVRDVLEKPDGEYTVLTAYQSGQVLAAKSEALQEVGSKKLANGDWVLLAGLPMARLDPNRRPDEPVPKQEPAPGVEKWTPPPDMEKEDASGTGKLNAPADGKEVSPGGEKSAKPAEKAPLVVGPNGILFLHPFLWLPVADQEKVTKAAATQ